VNLLLTSAGRHAYLVECFQAALAGKGRVFAADAGASAPALWRADGAFRAPPPDHAGYVEALLAFCSREHVSLLVPLGDPELPLLADARGRFREVGTTVVISPPEVIQVCLDAWAAHALLRQAGLRTPKTYGSLDKARRALKRGDVAFPLVVRPRGRTGDVAPEFAHDEEELELSHRRLWRRLCGGGEGGHAPLIQEGIAGEGYELDVVNDLRGDYVTTFARKKLGVRAGETDSAVTVRDERLSRLGEALGRRLKHVGPLCCDVLCNVAGEWVLELSPRLGDGYGFSHLAGADLPAALIAWAQGRAPDGRWSRAEPGVAAAKYSCLMRVPAPS